MSAIKKCQKCGVLYTGSATLCLGCQLKKSAKTVLRAGAHEHLNRAEKRALLKHRSEILKGNGAPVNGIAPDRITKKGVPVYNVAFASVVGKNYPDNVNFKKIKKKGENSLRESPKWIDANPPGYKKVVGIEPQPPKNLGLGDLARNEGRLHLEKKSNGVVKRLEIAQCSCGGENENCRRCYGSGYYEKELADPDVVKDSGSVLRRKASPNVQGEVGFASDSRDGATYGVRERGRFASNPLYDDYDE